MLNSFKIGSGKPHIWLHGLLGNCLNLSPLARTQAGSHHLLDARNHGSSFHRSKMDFKTLAEDVISYMDTNQINKAVMLGHSMGGKTAMALALLFPERVEGICVLDIAPVSYLTVMEQYYGYVRQYLSFIKTTNVDGLTRKEVEKKIQERFEDIKITQLIASNLKQDGEGFSWRIGVDELYDGISDVGGWEFEGKFEGPAHAIVGVNSIHTAKSPLVPKDGSLSSLYTKYFPNITIDIIQNAGHFLHVENPEPVKQSLSKYLSTFA